MTIINERAKTHGDYTQVAALSQCLKVRIRDARATASSEMSMLSLQQIEALEMICVKIARIVCGNPNEPDHWRDIAGYAELILKSLEGQKPGDDTQGTPDVPKFKAPPVTEPLPSFVALNTKPFP